MDQEAFQRVIKRIEGYKDEMIKLQKQLIAIPAIGPENGGDGEAERAKFLVSILRDLFDKIEVIKALDDRVPSGYRPSIVATTKGKSNERTIWLMPHLDVVPAGDESAWETPPFEGVVKDGKIYGRGSEDNNQGIVSTIFAAKALKEEGVLPSFRLGALFMADEEATNTHGPKYLMTHHKNIFSKKDLLIVPDAGKPDGSEVEIAEKSIVWLKVKTKGKQSHGAYPEKGVNAYRAAAHLICKMDQLYKVYPTRNDLFEPTNSTFEPTQKEANVQNINTIPGEDITYFDCRLLPPITTDDFLKKVEGYFREVEKEFDVSIEYELPECMNVLNPTPVDSPIVQRIALAAKEILNVDIKPIGIGGFTIAAYFRNAGLHVAVYSSLCETAHQPNEYCVIDNLVNDTKIWAHVLMQ